MSKYAFNLTNITNIHGHMYNGWNAEVTYNTISWSAEIYYKDGNQYDFLTGYDSFENLLNAIILVVDDIINTIPQSALDSPELYSYVNCLGDFGEREFIMLCKVNGRATVARFEKARNIMLNDNVHNWVRLSKSRLNVESETDDIE